MLVSTSKPRVSGRFDSCAKYFISCACPSCPSTKSFLVRLLISFPCLSRTLASMFTAFAFTEICPALGNGAWGAVVVCEGGAAWAGVWDGGAPWEVGGACGVGAVCWLH